MKARAPRRIAVLGLVGLSTLVVALPLRPASALDFVAVTFNSGTTPNLDHDADTTDGYTSQQASWSDQYYGDGLAWMPAIASTTIFFASLQPDVVALQEIFYSEECPSVPVHARVGFVCETWQPGDPTVAQRVLGPDYQIACNPGKPDKCLAVKKSFGLLRGCSADFCLDGLEGVTVSGCGGGARIARGLVDLVGGGTLTLVNVHATSGVTNSDQDCRKAQFDQIFADMDGQPGVNGPFHNLVLGDFNLDPARWVSFDPSAKRLRNYVPLDASGWFAYVSDVGANVTPTYLDYFNFDHLISDTLGGTCIAPGAGGEPPIHPDVYFDHLPIVCAVPEPATLEVLAWGAVWLGILDRRRRRAQKRNKSPACAPA